MNYYNRNKATQPKYVVVRCSSFGSGFSGWRLSEVDFYCFSNYYPEAKEIAEEWSMYGELGFVIKYENWLDKGGKEYDGDTLTERRYMY